MNEYLIAVNNYKKPKVIKGNKGNYYMILRLMLMEPGTNPLFPLMGLGLRSKSRFANEDQIQELKVKLDQQIEMYLPDLIANNIEMEMDENNQLKITISSDTEEYVYNTNDFDLDLDTLVEEYNEK